MKKTAIITLACVLVPLASAHAQAETAEARPAAPPAQHVPIHHALTGQAELRFLVREPDRAGAIVVRCIPRKAGARTHEVQARRGDTDYRAVIPLACAQPPGFSYFVVLRAAGGETPLFASAAAPHPVRVTHPPERESELARLRAHGYVRSRALLSAELVSFGERVPAPGAQPVPDRYYRIEAGYAYSFFGRIEDIALTVVRVRGENGGLPALPGGPAPLDPGIDYGRAAVTLFASDAARLRGALLLGASQEGFEWGGSGEIVLGDPRAEHVLFGGEALTTLGATAYLRLGFNATSAMPMGARVELTDFPLGDDAAVRLLYEIGYRFTPATELMLRGGYQGRTAAEGGPSLGAALRYGF